MTVRRRFITLLASGAFAAFGAPTESGAGEKTSVLHLFSITKSENKNRVEYAVRVDEACRPVGDLPVVAYWRMLERGPNELEGLLEREQPVYGLKEQARAGQRIVVRLAALPTRAIGVDVHQVEGRCQASALVFIGGVTAELERIHAELSWPFGIAHIDVAGRAVDGGKIVKERLRP